MNEKIGKHKTIFQAFRSSPHSVYCPYKQINKAKVVVITCITKFGLDEALIIMLKKATPATQANSDDKVSICMKNV